MADMAYSYFHLQNDDFWILDTGDTYHMAHRSDWLLNEKDVAKCSVLMPNGFRVDVRSIGDYIFILITF